MEDDNEEPTAEEVEAERPISALAELALCENLAQTSGWAAHWSAEMAQADGACSGPPTRSTRSSSASEPTAPGPSGSCAARLPASTDSSGSSCATGRPSPSSTRR